VVSQSVLAYIKTISPGSRLMRISNKIYTQTTKWISSMFFVDSLAAFLPTNTDCLAKALRLALTAKFGNFIKEGIQGLNCQTSIYISRSNPYLPDLKFSAHLIGLPQNAIKVVPLIESTESMDVFELEKQISVDKAAGIVPLFLLADLGSSFFGSTDGSLEELAEISMKHELWLHLSGPLLASFVLSKSQDVTKHVASMTLDMESWLGVPSIPNVLLHKQFPALQHSIFDIESDMKKLEAFPLWTVLQSVGREKISATFGHAFHSCKILYDMVSKTNGFRILSKRPIGDADPKESNAETSEIFAPVVVFQFDGSSQEPSSPSQDREAVVKKAIEKVNNASYFDRLNSWLGQTLERDLPQVQLSLLDHPVFGTCIRYSPFELSAGEKVSDDDAMLQCGQVNERKSLSRFLHLRRLRNSTNSSRRKLTSSSRPFRRSKSFTTWSRAVQC